MSKKENLSPTTQSQKGSPAKSTNSGGERDQWTHKLDFILSCVGYAIGKNNIQKNK